MAPIKRRDLTKMAAAGILLVCLCSTGTNAKPYVNGKDLANEYLLPWNQTKTTITHEKLHRRGERDVEGSGDDAGTYGDISIRPLHQRQMERMEVGVGSEEEVEEQKSREEEEEQSVEVRKDIETISAEEGNAGRDVLDNVEGSGGEALGADHEDKPKLAALETDSVVDPFEKEEGLGHLYKDSTEEEAETPTESSGPQIGDDNNQNNSLTEPDKTQEEEREEATPKTEIEGSGDVSTEEGEEEKQAEVVNLDENSTESSNEIENQEEKGSEAAEEQETETTTEEESPTVDVELVGEGNREEGNTTTDEELRTKEENGTPETAVSEEAIIVDEEIGNTTTAEEATDAEVTEAAEADVDEIVLHTSSPSGREEETTHPEDEETTLPVETTPEEEVTLPEGGSEDEESTTLSEPSSTSTTEEPIGALDVEISQEISPSEEMSTTEIPETSTDELPYSQPETTSESDVTIPILPEKPSTTEVPITTSDLPSTTSLYVPLHVPDVPQVVEEEEEKTEDVEETTIVEDVIPSGSPDLVLTPKNTNSLESALSKDSEDVLLGSAEPKRIGAYIVVGLILLSFLSLIGYIAMKKKIRRRRKALEVNQDKKDTEKALLSLSDYKDHPDNEENNIKNNELTPIVIKQNSQINKFEKNTNFSSPKNLNTTANEKNVEKDNVLKSTSDNLTQAIIEDAKEDELKGGEEEKTEKLIVRTHVDQDSIPKKVILVNRTGEGFTTLQHESAT